MYVTRAALALKKRIHKKQIMKDELQITSTKATLLAQAHFLYLPHLYFVPEDCRYTHFQCLLSDITSYSFHRESYYYMFVVCCS